MQNIIHYDINEIIALLIAVAMGSGAYLVFIWKKNQEKVNLKFIIIVLVINIFVTHTGSEILKKINLGEYRTMALPIIAYLGQYLMDWLDKRYPKIFDGVLKKSTGIDINDSNNNDNNNFDIENIEKDETEEKP